MALSDWNPFKPFVRSRDEVSWFLESALAGTLDCRDWDTFVRVPIRGAPDMEAIREECKRLEPFEIIGDDGKMTYATEGREALKRLLWRVKSDV